MNYIVHGLLQDYIDYKKLIENQAQNSFKNLDNTTLKKGPNVLVLKHKVGHERKI